MIDGTLYIDDFIDRIVKLIGVKLKDIMMKETVYILDHDYLGNILKEPIFITEGTHPNKLSSVYHDVLKKNVLVFQSNSNYIYYDIVTLHYIGYSDDNKTIKITTNIRSLKTILSLRDMLYLLGYENRYINLYHLNKEYINNIPKDISHNDYLNLICFHNV